MISTAEIFQNKYPCAFVYLFLFLKKINVIYRRIEKSIIKNICVPTPLLLKNESVPVRALKTAQIGKRVVLNPYEF